MRYTIPAQSHKQRMVKAWSFAAIAIVIIGLSIWYNIEAATARDNPGLGTSFFSLPFLFVAFKQWALRNDQPEILEVTADRVSYQQGKRHSFALLDGRTVIEVSSMDRNSRAITNLSIAWHNSGQFVRIRDIDGNVCDVPIDTKGISRGMAMKAFGPIIDHYRIPLEQPAQVFFATGSYTQPYDPQTNQPASGDDVLYRSPKGFLRDVVTATRNGLTENQYGGPENTIAWSQVASFSIISTETFNRLADSDMDRTLKIKGRDGTIIVLGDPERQLARVIASELSPYVERGSLQVGDKERQWLQSLVTPVVNPTIVQLLEQT